MLAFGENYYYCGEKYDIWEISARLKTDNSGILMKSISLAHHSCPLQARGLKSRQQPGFSDPICSSYRTKLQLNDAIRKYMKLGNRESKIAVVGQRKDIERVARFTSDPKHADISFDTWLPLNTYSSLPGKSINK